MQFNKMKRNGNVFLITRKKAFPENPRIFKKKTIKTAFDFAYDMTFGNVGQHRSNRSGGTIKRKNGEIFANVFQGKLAECAASNLFYKIDATVLPDFSLYRLGKWDSVDIEVCNKKIAVKSTKSFGNLLLLEQKDWDTDGRYIPNKDDGIAYYDYFVLIRIKPFCEDIMRANKWLYAKSLDRENLWAVVEKQDWSYDYAGYITLDDLRSIIQNGFVIKQGELLNRSTVMDADNYYVQAGDMKNVEELVRILTLSEEPAKPNADNETATTTTERKKPLKWYEKLFKLRR